MRYTKVNKVKPVRQVDYLQMLGEAMKFARAEESKPVLNTTELPVRMKKEVKE